ncbi:MAG TPA: hypothetical protein VFE50_24050 [Cyclobacteriaceae bacterium]|nr:hypothetical protein [Cyclobacteriaceae bacterium]
MRTILSTLILVLTTVMLLMIRTRSLYLVTTDTVKDLNLKKDNQR